LDPQAKAKKAAEEAALVDLVESPGWDLAMKQARLIFHQNHKVLRNRMASEAETQTARGALDAIMTLLKVVYTQAGQEVPSDLKPFYD
jgi:hypothetical protein